MAEQYAQPDYPTNPYKFNGKELDTETGLYYYGARYYNPRTSVWLSVDPLAEKYVGLSPYNYCANNPIILVDPDGSKIKIYYEVLNSKGQHLGYKSWTFNGKNSADAPKNEFVQNFLSAYKYNVKNGGGKYMKEAATNNNLEIPVMSGETDYEYMLYGSEKDGVLKGTVLFNPKQGFKTTDGKILSPATALEEEFDHAVDDAECHSCHWDRQRADDAQYENKEERRVAEGSVSQTAYKNGEVPENWVKPNHAGKHIIKDNWEYQQDK